MNLFEQQSVITNITNQNENLNKQIFKIENDKKEIEFENNRLKKHIQILSISTHNYINWDYNDIVNWIISLNKNYKKYEINLREKLKIQGYNGNHLNNMEEWEITQWGIQLVDHRRDIFKNIKKLTAKHNNNNVNHNNSNDKNNVHGIRNIHNAQNVQHYVYREGQNHAPTAYINR